MPRSIPVPDELSQPFWDACNDGRLLVQYCTYCDRRQFPPEPACRECGWQFHLTWLETSGRGTIVGYSVTHDSRTIAWHPEQPFVNAIISLEEDPVINFHSNLPGCRSTTSPSERRSKWTSSRSRPGNESPSGTW